MTPKSSLDPATLAALLDGRLSEPHAAAVREQLSNADQDTIDAYMDAVAVHAELASENPVAPAKSETPIAPRSGTSRRIWGSVFVSGLAAAIIFGVMRPSSNDDFAPATFAEALVMAPAEIGLQFGNVRGTTSMLSRRARAARIGALLTQIELGARTKNDVRSLVLTVAELLRDVPGGTALATRYEGLAATPARLANTDDRTQLGQHAMTLVGTDLARLGAYVQAVIVASTNADTSYFQQVLPPAAGAYTNDADLPASMRDAVDAFFADIRRDPKDIGKVRGRAELLLHDLTN